MHYYCSECKLAVIVIEGELIKACRCEAAVVAEMAATIEAKATVNNGN